MPLYHGCDACKHHSEHPEFPGGPGDCHCSKGLSDEHGYRCIDSFGLSRAAQRRRCPGFGDPNNGIPPTV